EYWQGLSESPEYVIMFLPYESVYLAALEADPELTETSLTSNVIITSPHTLLGLLRAVERGWRQQRLAESALKLSQLGQELYDRMATLSEFMLDLGRSLGGSVKSYNKLIGSFESRAFSTARKFKDLGVGEKKRIEEINPLEVSPRLLNLPDIRQIPAPEDFK
ncbi:MAG: DNA recombination protein RmuC, partial [Proteobacteria bacterium]|nr:DNA recombination protein RmuC [Pseudomonadota bacterium]